MRLYYEANETSKEPMADTEFIRVDITDMTDTEKADALKAIKDVMTGKTYRLTEHTCGHDEKSACVMREI